jgi:HlyD family secretion protein
VNLEYASIFSPIDGVVLNRAVDEGQTVAASFNTPTLFTIANDLTRMQVQANVDEADIGQVATGQRAEFSVDAFPEETFSGTVTEIRLQPVISSNVVTYTVIVNAPNPEKKLMPGMTASITVFSQESSGVIIIPAKALTFNPPAGTDSDGVKIAGNPGQAPHVWVYDGKQMLPKRVNTGLSDGNFTEIKSGLSAGEEVVTLIKEQQSSEPGEKKVTSPFIPKRPGGSKDKTPPPPQ